MEGDQQVKSLEEENEETDLRCCLIPLCSKAVADQEAGRFVSKPSQCIVILC